MVWTHIEFFWTPKEKGPINSVLLVRLYVRDTKEGSEDFFSFLIPKGKEVL